MPSLRNALAQRIRFLRQERHWTQEQLGEHAGLTYKFIGQVERAEVSLSVESLAKIAKAFDLTVSELLAFQIKGTGKSKEEIFQELSKREMQTVKEALEILGRIFR